MSEVIDMSNEQVHEAAIAIQKEIDQLASKQARILSEWDHRRIWADDKSLSPVARYARETGLSQDDARRLITRAKKLRSMYPVHEAFDAGEISSSRVDLLGRALTPATAGPFSRDQKLLLETIKGLSFVDALKAIQYWKSHADEDGSKKKSEKLDKGRHAHCSRTFEGTVDLGALFDPIRGEIFSDELERLERELFEEEWAKAKAVHGDNVLLEHLDRTPAQRRCDALVLMAERSATAGVTKKPKPLISIVVGIEGFEKVCELASGTVIEPSMVMPYLEDAEIESIIFDGRSRLKDVSHQRSFKGALRTALEARDRHCQHESGCSVPAKQCEGDHIEAYSRGGQTEIGNGQLLCPPHNRAKGSSP